MIDKVKQYSLARHFSKVYVLLEMLYAILSVVCMNHFCPMNLVSGYPIHWDHGGREREREVGKERKNEEER